MGCGLTRARASRWRIGGLRSSSFTRRRSADAFHDGVGSATTARSTTRRDRGASGSAASTGADIPIPKSSSSSSRAAASTRRSTDLNGMFAIALWDRQSRALHLVRDRIGHQAAVLLRARGQFVLAQSCEHCRPGPTARSNSIYPQSRASCGSAMCRRRFASSAVCRRSMPGEIVSIVPDGDRVARRILALRKRARRPRRSAGTMRQGGNRPAATLLADAVGRR